MARSLRCRLCSLSASVLQELKWLGQNLSLLMKWRTFLTRQVPWSRKWFVIGMELPPSFLSDGPCFYCMVLSVWQQNVTTLTIFFSFFVVWLLWTWTWLFWSWVCIWHRKFVMIVRRFWFSTERVCWASFVFAVMFAAPLEGDTRFTKSAIDLKLSDSKLCATTDYKHILNIILKILISLYRPFRAAS